MRFGVQTALQNTRPNELIPLWRRLEDLGYDWISVWDHFHAVGGGTDNLEAMTMHTALALCTERVRVGGLVYSVNYRPLAVLANGIAAIDHLSNGRATLGLGAGYMQSEYDAWGYDFPPPRDRLDLLEDSLSGLRRLFAGEAVTEHRRHLRLEGAVCDPTPVQERLPIWIGGGGEQRTIPMAARLADGWNVPMASLSDFDRKVRILDHHIELAGRDRRAVERSVGLGLCWDRSLLAERFGNRAASLEPMILGGSTGEVTERVAAYREAGADWLLVSIRAPFDLEELERFAEEIVPEFR
ncbi:mer, partial [Symbiodinium sp. KB8]